MKKNVNINMYHIVTTPTLQNTNFLYYNKLGFRIRPIWLKLAEFDLILRKLG